MPGGSKQKQTQSTPLGEEKRRWGRERERGNSVKSPLIGGRAWVREPGVTSLGSGGKWGSVAQPPGTVALLEALSKPLWGRRGHWQKEYAFPS